LEQRTADPEGSYTPADAGGVEILGLQERTASRNEPIISGVSELGEDSSGLFAFFVRAERASVVEE